MHRLFRHVCLGSGVLLAALAAGMAGAMEDGFYLGAAVGQSKVFAKSAWVENEQASANQKTGTGVRLFMGGQFNPHAAFEVGYNSYGSAAYDVTAASGNRPAVRVYGLDAGFRLMWPLFSSGLSVFVTPAVAVAHASRSGSLTLTQGGSRVGTETSFRPQLGAGVSYELNQRWVLQLAFSHLYGSGNLPSTNLLSLGISWHMVDEKCGQFLC